VTIEHTDPATAPIGAPISGPVAAPEPAAAARGRDRAVVLLAALSGATDAVGLLALGGSFTSVMTGNMVLVGVGIGTHDASALGRTVAAIVGYVAGVFVGARVAGEPQPGEDPWPARVTRGLLLELACFAVFAAVWWGTGGHPSSALFAPLLCLNAAALGIQSSVIIRYGVSGLSTTYMTGTLTTMVARLAGRHPLASVGRSGVLLAGLIAGAAVAGLACTEARVLVPALQLLLIGGAVLIGLRLRRAARVGGAAR
jgi:uncharacterized membrane protein YoaK (UPF0700 family)